MMSVKAGSPDASRLAERLHAELEQAQVAIEDMNERLTELTHANEELAVRLKEEARLREATELQLAELRSRVSRAKPETGEEAMLRQELSVALEELQVMQEELQVAHDALSARQPPAR